MRYLTLILLLACNRTEPAPTPAFTPEQLSAARAAWPAEVAAAIDSANEAYGAQQFDRAALLFRRAAAISPDITAAWFGVYIAEHARGNVAAADSALDRARALSEAPRSEASNAEAPRSESSTPEAPNPAAPNPETPTEPDPEPDPEPAEAE